MHPDQSGSLAERLYLLREASGLTGEQLAAAMGWNPATGRGKVSKIENGRQVPSEKDIDDWATACGNPGQVEDLLDLLAGLQVSRTRWRQGLRNSGAAAVQENRNQSTLAATRIRNVETLLVPGLLQTQMYARAVFTQVALLHGRIDVDTAVAKRMERQQALYDPSKTFEFITTEAALCLLPCPVQVMLGQLDRLLSLAMDNVTLGIIPFGAEVPFAPYNSFLLSDDTLTVETFAGSDEETGEAAKLYHRAFDLLLAGAVTGEDAHRMIMQAAQRLRDV